MKRRPYVDDYYRKIRIAFYPKREEDIEEFKPYFNPVYFSIKGVSLFEDINTKIYNQLPDLIVCTDNYKIISNKIDKYIYYISFLEYLNHPKEVCAAIRKQAFHNYIDKIKEQIGNEIEKNEDLSEVIYHIVNLLDLKNEYLKDHSIRVMHYSLMLGKALKLKEEELKELKYASLLHDIGKLAVPSKILAKPSDYSDYEYTLYKYHTLIGEYLIDFPYFETIKKIIRLHHERIDGKGYLNKKGIENIPLLARIILIANTFDRLTTSNFYNKRYSYEEAVEIMANYSKDITSKKKVYPFDPKLVKIFLKEIKKEPIPFLDMNQFLDKSLKNAINVEKEEVFC